MAEEQKMPNMDMSEFPSVSGVENVDFVVVSRSGGSAGRASLSLLETGIGKQVRPVIKDGTWWIGSEDTGVKAEGRTPEFRNGEMGIEYRYAGEGDDAWRTFVSYEDLRVKYSDLSDEQIYQLRMRFEDLTPEQQDALRLKYEDLTEEQKEELQRPATEAATRVAEEEKAMKEAEAARVNAESQRVKAEEQRAASEAERAKAHEQWSADEYSRKRAEDDRVEQESLRKSAEEARASAEKERQRSETVRQESENVRQQWYEEASKQWGNQTLSIDMEENGNISVFTGGIDTGFRDGRIENNGNVVLEFYFW